MYPKASSRRRNPTHARGGKDIAGRPLRRPVPYVPYTHLPYPSVPCSRHGRLRSGHRVDPQPAGWGGAAILLAFILAALFILVGLSGCGIETIPYIAPPLNVYQDTPISNDSTFVHDYTNNVTDDFFGYELYYRIYDANGNDTSAQDEAQIAASTVPGITLLQQYHFVRMLSDQSLSGGGLPPLIPIATSAKGNPVNVIVDFSDNSNLTNDDATATWTDTANNSVNLRRNDVTVAGNPQALKGFFNGDYSQTDPDLYNISLSSSSSLFVVVYVLGYGVDISNLNQIYSEPEFLGKFNLIYSYPGPSG